MLEHGVIDFAVDLDADPVPLVAVVRLADGIGEAFLEFGHLLGGAFNGNRREIIDVEIAEHVPGHIKHENGEPSPREFLEGCRLGHSRQRQAIFA